LIWGFKLSKFLLSALNKNWICCQLGGREHYAIPRALHLRGALNMLFTDAWVGPGNPLGYLNRSLGDRYHPELADASVKSDLPKLLGFEGTARIAGIKGWDRTLARNDWFQECAVAALTNQRREWDATPTRPPVLFAYSYAAKAILLWAKERGWQTVLAQIDAGPEMERTVERLHKQHPEYRRPYSPPSSRYWDDWRDECMLADKIIVNSHWVRKALLLEDIPASKLRIAPLAFEKPKGTMDFHRIYPEVFTAKRPMRVLFLGQVSLLKGIVSLLEATELLRDEPIQFHIVGQVQVNIPTAFLNHPRIVWEGLVPRSAVAPYYQRSDVFIFPTHCDGFGLTQLEAQAWQLPVIASRHCGDVIVDGLNGVQLSEVTGSSIANVLHAFLRSPATLQNMAQNSEIHPTFSLANVGRILGECATLGESNANNNDFCNIM
jgi:glycosyltransferase involved in cell wall biosynthesis